MKWSAMAQQWCYALEKRVKIWTMDWKYRVVFRGGSLSANRPDFDFTLTLFEIGSPGIGVIDLHLGKASFILPYIR